MSERPQFRAGEIVDVTLGRVHVVNHDPAANTLTVQRRDDGDVVVVDLAGLGRTVHVTRVAPAEWPPCGSGELWEDGDRGRWMSQHRERHFETRTERRFVMVPANDYGQAGGSEVEVQHFLVHHGPVELIHRDPVDDTTGDEEVEGI